MQKIRFKKLNLASFSIFKYYSSYFTIAECDFCSDNFENCDGCSIGSDRVCKGCSLGLYTLDEAGDGNFNKCVECSSDTMFIKDGAIYIKIKFKFNHEKF